MICHHCDCDLDAEVVYLSSLMAGTETTLRDAILALNLEV